MNKLVLSSTVMPVMSSCDFLAASEPFLHPDRITDYHVLIYVAEGEIHVTEGDTDFTVGAGELLFLKSGVHHYGKQFIPRGTKWYYVHFALEQVQLPEFVPDSSPIPQATPLESSLILPKQLHGLAGSDIERDISELTRYFHCDDVLRRWRLNSMLFSLLSRIALHEAEAAQPLSLTDRICAYLADNIRSPFSAAAVSSEFYLSYKHLAAVFKKEKGETMQQYHARLRINEACRLLRSTLLPVGEIALQLGFQDMLYFSRCFRSSTGLSPTEYRKLPPVY